MKTTRRPKYLIEYTHALGGVPLYHCRIGMSKRCGVEQFIERFDSVEAAMKAANPTPYERVLIKQC